MREQEISKLTAYIEENLRSSKSSGLPFVDTRNFLSRLGLRQNHVVYGRRGSGKTTLVRASINSSSHLRIYIDLENFKDITFPNILIRVLLEMYHSIEAEISECYPWFRFSVKASSVRRKVHKARKLLETYLHDPDLETRDVNTKESYGVGASANVTGQAISGEAHSKTARSTEVKRTITTDKLDFLRKELPYYKELINTTSSLLNDRPIFLVLDDFYFVNKETQPDLIDYFHRLTKDTALYLKVATIKHRSKLYRRTGDSIIGVEPTHDVQDIDMDYTLNNFDELQAFMRQLLEKAIEQSGAQLSFDDIFSGEGFSQLCLGSGGVPRDFLSLFILLSNKFLMQCKAVSKVEVTDIAITNLNNKRDSMKKDSGNEDAILEDYLLKIKKYVYNDNRTNAFLISKEELSSNAQMRQAIRELVDLRLLHLIDDNISKAPSDGLRYEAYILDIALYDNSRPRKFEQIEPGHSDAKSRKDDLRSSPVLSAASLGNIGAAKTISGFSDAPASRVASQQLKLSFD